jgi:predicted RNA-binding Zn ribbon-like protein
MSETREQLKGFKFVGGALCLDFANAGGLLNDYGDLLVWGQLAGAVDESQAEHLGRRAESTPDQARTAFVRANSLRKAIHRIFSAQARGHLPAERDLALLSTVVGRSATRRKLQPSTEGFTWRWHDVEDRLDWPTWIIARSAVGLLTSDRLSRVRECSGPDCGWLFVDASRNRSRRWCDMAECGNRAKARRNYARKRRSIS